MNHLKAMKVFAEVSDQDGFAAAARTLKLSTSGVSRYLASLEDWLGTQLFHRTTRQLNLTVEGKSVLAHCKLILTEIPRMARPSWRRC